MHAPFCSPVRIVKLVQAALVLRRPVSLTVPTEDRLVTITRPDQITYHEGAARALVSNGKGLFVVSDEGMCELAAWCGVHFLREDGERFLCPASVYLPESAS
jgi:hypothetical protein